MAAGLLGSTRPILSPPCSVNQMFPSGPMTIPSGIGAGSVDSNGIGNSVTVGAATADAPGIRRSRSRSGSVLSECFIECLVHEFVGAHVLLAPHRADGPFVETPQLSHGLGKQMLKTWMLHLVLPADLARDEL